jgi:hypothetical protein
MSIAGPRSKHQLRVSSYDKVSGWIVAMLIVTCVTVGALFLIYVTRKFIVTQFATPVTPFASGGGGVGGSGSTTSAELDPPSVEEDATFDEPQMQDTLTAVATAVSNRTAILADEQLDIELDPTQRHGDNRSPGAGGGRGGGIGGGIGSGFGPGRGSVEPRREIRYEPSTLLEYAQWLDYFKIELGILQQEENKVYYAKNLAKEKPDVYVGDPAKEQRLFMNPTDSQFAALDRQLVTKAGIGDKGRIILQFYPPEAQQILYTLERQKAGERKPDAIRGTIFRVTHTGNRFEFSVIEQTYK